MGSGQEGITEGWWAEPEAAVKAAAGERSCGPECGDSGVPVQKEAGWVGVVLVRVYWGKTAPD